MAEIKIENLRHVYSSGTPFERVAIENVNLTIPQGQFVGLIGHTGSGKSTLIQHLNALLSPTSGRVLLDGKDINENKVSRRDCRYQVGLVFQYPEYQLFEETVYKDIAFGPKNMKLPEAEIDKRVREAADFAGVDPAWFSASPLELSGGQKRRVAIAGVISMRPGVLVLDEPTAGLDPEACATILENLRNYQEKTGSTVIIVSHSMDDVARLADRLIVMNGGHVEFDGTPEEVFSHAARLTEIGLNVPAAARIAMALRTQGMDLPESIYTYEMLLDAVLRAKEASAC